MNAVKFLSFLWFISLLAACVTINVYFPAAEAEKAADIIIDQVYQNKKATQPPPSEEQPAPSPQSRLNDVVPRLASTLLFALVQEAQAQADFNISSPRIQALQTRMANRHNQLAGFYQNGAIGIQSDGMLSIRNKNAIPLPSRNLVNTLVGEENEDRNALYREIAQANGHPEWEGQIREVFAQRWRDKAQAGWWIQQPNGQWVQK